MEVYEVRNPSFSDMNIEAQIDAGINDWVAVVFGKPFYSETRAGAVFQAEAYNGRIAATGSAA